MREPRASSPRRSGGWIREWRRGGRIEARASGETPKGGGKVSKGGTDEVASSKALIAAVQERIARYGRLAAAEGSGLNRSDGAGVAEFFNEGCARRVRPR